MKSSDEEDRQADVDQGRDRVAERPVGPVQHRGLDPQRDHGADHEHVERDVDRDDVLEQVVVEVAVLTACRGRVGRHGDRQGQQRRPEPLGGQGDGRHVVAVGRADAP